MEMIIFTKSRKYINYIEKNAIPYLNFISGEETLVIKCRTIDEAKDAIIRSQRMSAYCMDIRDEDDLVAYREIMTDNKRLPVLLNAAASIAPVKYVAGGVSPDTLIRIYELGTVSDKAKNLEALRDYLRRRVINADKRMIRGKVREDGRTITYNIAVADILCFKMRDRNNSYVYARRENDEHKRAGDESYKGYIVCSVKGNIQTLTDKMGPHFYLSKRASLINKIKIKGADTKKSLIYLEGLAEGIAASRKQSMEIADIIGQGNIS
ncbi:hypothetical protein [Butyrivibrio sp. MC2013]|uniref:hypothetical protein n=1 Tax=Butyrivibrio sp. MC2013 TaxID=1280686 RepID=UPI0004178685|nr:hypothetical protein [Butyrivibrio sp. MC2013]